MSDCLITGTLKWGSVVAPLTPIYVHRVINSELQYAAPHHVATSDINGVIRRVVDGSVTELEGFHLPQGCSAYIEAQAERLNTSPGRGVLLAIPNASTATLASLIPPSFPITQEGFNFLALGDTPDAYTGQAGKIPAVKGDESGLEFVEVATDAEVATAVAAEATARDAAIATASTADRARSNHTGSQAISTVSGLQAALDAEATARADADALLAPKASPALSGTPTAPTPVNATSSTQLATTAFVHALITDLLGSAPANLDTLQEIAAQLATDESAVSALTTTVAGKLAKASNLADLVDAAIARANLGLGNVANADTTTTANITDSTNKRFVTDAQRTVIQNTSNVNTGDQTSVTGNAGTATALQNSRTIDGQAFNGTANITIIAPGTHAATSKATPVDADEVPLVDSAASNVLKRLTWANLNATLKTYFDTLYQNALGFTPENVANKDIDGTLSANSDTKYPSQKAVKTYVDSRMLRAYKTADTLRSSTTTLTADPHLSLTLATGKVYRIDFEIYFYGDVSIAKVDFNGGTATMAGLRGEAKTYSLDGDGLLNVVGINTLADESAAGFAGATTLLQGSIIVEVNAGGTLVMRWAQVASDATATTVYKYSNITATLLN